VGSDPQCHPAHSLYTPDAIPVSERTHSVKALMRTQSIDINQRQLLTRPAGKPHVWFIALVDKRVGGR